LALLQKIAPRVHGAICYWGVDVAQVRKEMSTPVTLPNELLGRPKAQEDIWAIYAGTLGPNYDIETILKAAAILKERGAPVTILIAGDGVSSVRVRKEIELRELDNCVFLGSLPAAAVAALYPRCDLALSTYVGGSTVSMPIKAYDYFAAGLPIVNSLGRDLGEFVRTRRVGLQYEAQSAEGLADAIYRLGTNPALRAECAANAKILGEEFDWRKQYQDYVRIVEAVGQSRCNRAT
jgi:glycosyltransferase involved in cell wall biosynthesis